MATNNKKRDLLILMHTYSKHEHIFRGKSNTAAVAKEKELCLNVVFSFNGEFSLITLITLQIKTVSGTETKKCFSFRCYPAEKSALESS